MPQWDFLNFLAARGKAYPSFDLRMQAELLRQGKAWWPTGYDRTPSVRPRVPRR
jgi:hypothetical protein